MLHKVGPNNFNRGSLSVKYSCIDRQHRVKDGNLKIPGYNLIGTGNLHLMLNRAQVYHGYLFQCFQHGHFQEVPFVDPVSVRHRQVINRIAYRLILIMPGTLKNNDIGLRGESQKIGNFRRSLYPGFRENLNLGFLLD
jgi:hypothetical protein